MCVFAPGHKSQLLPQAWVVLSVVSIAIYQLMFCGYSIFVVIALHIIEFFILIMIFSLLTQSCCHCFISV